MSVCPECAGLDRPGYDRCLCPTADGQAGVEAVTEPEQRLRCPRCLSDARITVHQQIVCLNKEICGSVWTAAEAALVGLDQFRPEDPERQEENR